MEARLKIRHPTFDRNVPDGIRCHAPLLRLRNADAAGAPAAPPIEKRESRNGAVSELANDVIRK